MYWRMDEICICKTKTIRGDYLQTGGKEIIVRRKRLYVNNNSLRSRDYKMVKNEARLVRWVGPVVRYVSYI